MNYKHFVMKDVSKFLIIKIIDNNEIAYRFYHGTIEGFKTLPDVKERLACTNLPPLNICEYWAFDETPTQEEFEKITDIKLHGVIGWRGGSEFAFVEDMKNKLRIGTREDGK